MGFTEAIILGLVQGITEFLPISSSGHLVIVRNFLTVTETNSLAIDSVLHLATTLAIILYFRKDIWSLIQTSMRKLGRLPVNNKDVTLLYALIFGTIPAVCVGLLMEPIMEKYFYSPAIVAGALVIAALFFMYAEWKYYVSPPNGSLTIRRGILIGFFQIFALIPGFSRSGATLAGGMLLGLTRIESARFSFLLAIPITLGLGTKKLLEIIITGNDVSWVVIFIAAVISFFSALIVIHFFLTFIRRYTLWPFIWYSLALAAVVGYVVLSH